MNALKFHVSDSWNHSEREEMVRALEKLGGQHRNAQDALVLIVHGRTDAPEKKYGITEKDKQQCLKRGGIYINYTTASEADWIRIAERTYHGTYREILRRLYRLKKPVSLNDIKQAFDYHSAISVYVPALCILCQGYLAAHFPKPYKTSGPVKEALDRMGWTKLAETGEGKAFADKVAAKVDQTNNPEWWRKIFDIPKKELVEKVEEEWGAEELPNDISELFQAIQGTNLSDKAELVAQVYLKLGERLEESTL